MKNLERFNSKSMGRASIQAAPSGKAATTALAALLVLEFSLGIGGCSKSKPGSQPSAAQQNSSNQSAASLAAPPLPSQASVVVTQTESAQKKSIRGPVRKLPRTLTYSDADAGLSFSYPRKSTLRAGERAELEAVGLTWLPMNFAQTGGITLAMLELPSGAKEQKDSRDEFFAVSVHKNLSAEQCGQFAAPASAESEGNSSAQSGDKSTENLMPGSKVSIHGVDYSEFDRQAEQGRAKYYHRFVPQSSDRSSSAENNSCYEFALAVRSAGKTEDGETHSADSALRDSGVGNKDAFARLERILASVKIKADSELPQVAADGSFTAEKQNEATETAKAGAKGDESPR